ncbi:hypothetical protein ACWGVR_10520 [Streptomyces xanthophaeus]
MEALEPDELWRLVLAAIDPYIDRDVFAQQIAREEQQRRALEGCGIQRLLGSSTPCLVNRRSV